MNILLVSILCLICVLQGNAFAPRPAIVARPFVATTTGGTTTSLNVFGNKKSAAAKAKAQVALDNDYWEGEWVCKDCGYIYNRVR